jgi:hypothetical protein
MMRSGERRLYQGLVRLEHEADAKLRELMRYARVSFVLDVQNHGSLDLLSLQRAWDFSRNKDSLPIYLLGAVENEGASKPRLLDVAKSLCRVLAGLEAPPQRDAAQWVAESFNGAGRPLVPVAIHGTDYFQGHGFVSAPETYRTDDPVSQEFLRQLKG